MGFLDEIKKKQVEKETLEEAGIPDLDFEEDSPITISGPTPEEEEISFLRELNGQLIEENNILRVKVQNLQRQLAQEQQQARLGRR